jgi:hypothetical protein
MIGRVGKFVGGFTKIFCFIKEKIDIAMRATRRVTYAFCTIGYNS